MKIYTFCSFVVGLILCPLFLFAQEEEKSCKLIDDRLYEVYDTSYIDQLNKEDPSLLRRWTFYLDHAYYITDRPLELEWKNYPPVVIKDLKNINILLLEKEQQLRRNWNRPSIYRISNTKKFLVYWPGKQFTSKMRSNLSAQKD